MDAVLVVVVMFATLLAAALTVPAGFGLATMLTPVMLLWLDPHLAIAAVAAYTQPTTAGNWFYSTLISM